MTIWERRPVTIKAKCPGCGEVFTKQRRNQTYCTSLASKCRTRVYRKTKRKPRKG